MPRMFPVVLSGGSGTRLWPLSRAAYPKQFIRFSQEQSASFLAASLRRLPAAEGFERPIVVCNNDHRFLVRDEAEQAGIEPGAIVLEPMARNTAPAIAAGGIARGAHRAGRHHRGDAVGPCDQGRSRLPRQRCAGRARLPQRASSCCSASRPTRRTRATATSGAARRCRTSRAHSPSPRSPRSPTARPQKAMSRAGSTIGTAASSCSACARFWTSSSACNPCGAGSGRGGLAGAQASDHGFLHLDGEAFAQGAGHLRRLCGDGKDQPGSRAADRRRLERRRLLVVAVGAERAATRRATPCKARPCSRRPSDSYIHSERALVATIGVKDLVIVNTPDALLVADKARAQDVGGIVARLKAAEAQGAREPRPRASPVGLLRERSTSPRAFGSSSCTSIPVPRCPCKCISSAPGIGSWCRVRPR